jgi:hypothetical protein
MNNQSLYIVVRLAAEGSDWKRDQGETLSAWAERTLRHNPEMVMVPRSDLEWMVTRYEPGHISTIEAADYGYSAYSHVRKWLADHKQRA